MARLAGGTSFFALAIALHIAAPARAQTAAVEGANDLEEVVVTGSRLTTGFETATPVTAITSENLLAASPSIADALRQLPALAATLPTTSTSSGNGGANGQSILNLRNLGANRGLVLLNGRRVVSSNQNMTVDLNVMPQNLVSRVDVVTGGASAAYGSDAVAGVVNLVLDTEFVGLKGDVIGGISTYGDLPKWGGSLAWGGSFANDRLHVIASTQYFQQHGVYVHKITGRDWWDKPWGLINNTTGSGPLNLVLPNITSSVGTDGGLIASGPLKGTQFLKGGVPAPFNYGYSAGTTWASGGDGSWISFNLSPDTLRSANFVHATYDVSERAQVFAELSYSWVTANDRNQKGINNGTGFGYTIFRDNAFLPASVAARMDAAGVTSFLMGRYMRELPDVTVVSEAGVFRQAVGIKGSVGADDNWNYDVSYSHGRANQFLAQKNLTIARPTYAAADAVVNPQTGQVVCRSQYYSGNTFVPGGTGLDPKCKPQNLFGYGSIDPTTVPYMIGDSWKDYTQDQHVFAATISGDLGDFSLEAGPIAVATGVEWRREKASQITDDISVQTVDFTGIRGGPAAYNGRVGPFRFANFQPFGGRQSVKEGFVEVGVPLLTGAPGAEKLSTDFAIRYTDYSTSGGVTTWKAGADWQVIPDIRFRGTVSRDIRAPNLLELFNSATQNSGNAIYPSSTTGTSITNVNITSGNPNLMPERALTQTYGVVLTPTFLEGFQLSLDYYNIKIKGGINTVPTQQTIDNCFAGVPGFCALVNLVGGTVQTRTPFLNLAEVRNAGIDLEARYNTELWGNPLQLALLGTYLSAASTQPAGGAVLSTVGGGNDPRLRLNLQANYEVGNWKVFLQQRFIGKKFTDATRLEGVFVDDNTVDPAFYTDATFTYSFEAYGAANEVYLTVNNITNQEPPKDIIQPSSFVQPGNRVVYDWIGRYFTVGMRFKF